MDGIDISLSSSGLAALRPATATGPSAPVVPTPEQASTARSDGANLISLLADAAPPVDSKKVEAIRALIGQGAYPIDEHAIAAKMIALDVAVKQD